MNVATDTTKLPQWAREYLKDAEDKIAKDARLSEPARDIQRRYAHELVLTAVQAGAR